MKKQALGIGLLACLSLFSCKKDVTQKEETGKPKGTKIISTPPFTTYRLGTDILEDDFINVAHDADYQAFNKISYALTLGLLEIAKDNTLWSNLLSEIDATRNKYCNLYDFADEHTGVDEMFNEAFSTRFGDDFSSFANWREFLAERYVYNETHYTPFAMFANPNLSSVDINLPAFVGAPLGIDEDKFTSFDDHIPVWPDPNDQGTITVVNETMAGNYNNAMVLVNNNQVGIENRIFEPVNPNPPTPPLVPMSCKLPRSVHVHEHLTHTKFKINERYEASGKSEYVFAWGSGIAYRPDLLNWVTHVSKTGSKKIKVPKGDIGKLIDAEFDVFTPDAFDSPRCFEIALLANYAPAMYKHYSVGAFEKDWFGGWQLVLKYDKDRSPNPPATEDVYGRMTFDNEWYFHDPQGNESYPFNTRNPTTHSTYTNTVKGELRLHRWD